MKRWHRFAIAVAIAALVPAAGGATYAAFRATSPNGGDRIEAGSVQLSDNDSGGSMLSFSGGYPGHTDTGCIEVTYSGSLDAGVRLYGNTTGTGLDQYLDLKVTRGTYSSNPGFDSCTNFTADATNYIGAGAGVIYNGTLQGYADDYAGGLVDPPSGGAETWTTGEKHVYRIQVTLQNNAAAGKEGGGGGGGARAARGQERDAGLHVGGAQPVTRTPPFRGRTRALLAGIAAAMLLACGAGAAIAAFSATTTNPGNAFTAAASFAATSTFTGYGLVDESSNGQPVDATWPLAFDDSILFTTTAWANAYNASRYLDFDMSWPAPVGRQGRVERQLQDEVRLDRRGGLGQRVLLLRGAARLHRRRARDLRQLGQPGGVQHRRHPDGQHHRHLRPGHEHDDRERPADPRARRRDRRQGVEGRVRDRHGRHHARQLHPVPEHAGGLGRLHSGEHRVGPGHGGRRRDLPDARAGPRGSTLAACSRSPSPRRSRPAPRSPRRASPTRTGP